MIRIASFNVENLFRRAKALNGDTWNEGRPILKAHQEVNDLLNKETYTEATKTRIIELFIELDLYYVNEQDAVRRRQSVNPKWAWFRKNRGTFDREPTDASESVEIIATGRKDFLGWVDLAKEQVDEEATRMTARVIREVNADILGVIEVEDRPSLVKLNEELMEDFYGHAMLIDGNDERGIDVGIMTKPGVEIRSIRSHVDDTDDSGVIFSRDCAQFEVVTPSGAVIHVLVNHFKSQSGGGGPKRKRQAKRVRQIVDALVENDQHVVVVGDLNEGAAEGEVPENLRRLFREGSPLISCYALPDFDVGERPGTFDSCGWRDRLDYILVSESLADHVSGGQLFRKGLWGSRETRPDKWETYSEMESSRQQASDHAAVVLDLDI